MDKQSKPTPGPWIASAYFTQREGGRTYIPVLRPGNDPVPLAIVHRDVDGYGKGEGDANARLIAAAPTMYEYIASSASAGCATAKNILEKIHANRAEDNP